MTYRLYFNRCEDYPQIWSIDEGDVSTEVNVCGFTCGLGVEMASGQAADLAAVTEREPKAWVAVHADSVEIRNGRAVFYTRTITRADVLGLPRA